MPTLHETATITAKGQLTLPKRIRQALGVGYGGKVAFDMRKGQVVVTRADSAGHDDPAITAFLGMLERDMRAGKHLRALPNKLAQVMLANAGRAVNLNDAIEGEVAL